MKTIPVGYICVLRHTYPENGEEYFTFVRWNGKQWTPYRPVGAERERLILSRQNSAGKIVNTYGG